MRRKKLAVLSICLLAALTSIGGLKETYVEEYIPQVSERVESTYQEAIEIDLDINTEYKNEADFVDTEKNVDVFNEDEGESIEESEEDEDTIDPNIPFQAGRFEWWWIVVIVGTIGLFFFIAWLVFFIWDRKDKKKYKKKQ